MLFVTINNVPTIVISIPAIIRKISSGFIGLLLSLAEIYELKGGK